MDNKQAPPERQHEFNGALDIRLYPRFVELLISSRIKLERIVEGNPCL
jgi:hypothetical protein